MQAKYIKPMVYKKKRKYTLLAEGVHMGYNWWVLSCGFNPLGYVEIPITHPLSNRRKYPRVKIYCHGGITWHGPVEFAYHDVISWGYVEDSDYWSKYQYRREQGGKKWTTEEVMCEIECVIGQLEHQKDAFLRRLLYGDRRDWWKAFNDVTEEQAALFKQEQDSEDRAIAATELVFKHRKEI